ncbi:MAG: NAD(P)-dependent dehydrogenase (short-subunit alcohol dehydrogenase family) [Gammaproteobacteria bacterium]|jgi:NAD(P)-dependent dehydrogenase (short-subunit alcohol dehydrogenase family)
MSALQGKTAIVTGAASGIGRSIALAFANEGANVICADVDLRGCDETVDLAQADSRVLSVCCDVSSAAAAEASVALAQQHFGALHVLVNNAAAFVPYATVVELDEADWSRSLSVNLTGPFLMSKFAVPLIAASGGGSIIHMASQLGQVGKPGHCWYGAAKAALIQLAKIMALDHAAQNIRVNTLSPGPVGTARIHQKYGGKEQAERVGDELYLMRRLGRPEEIASAAVFLASDASSYMTGADLLIDGGYTAR